MPGNSDPVDICIPGERRFHIREITVANARNGQSSR